MDVQQQQQLQEGGFSEKPRVAPQLFPDIFAVPDNQTDFTRLLKKELLGRAAASSSSFQLSSFTVVPQMASGSGILSEPRSQNNPEKDSKETMHTHTSSFAPVQDPCFPQRDHILSSGSDVMKSRLSQGLFDTSSFVRREREGDIQSWKTVSSNYFQKENERLERKFLENCTSQLKKYIMLDVKNSSNNGSEDVFGKTQQQQQQQNHSKRSSMMSVVYEEKYLGNGQMEMQELKLNPQDEEQMMFQTDLLSVERQSEQQDKGKKKELGKNKQEEKCQEDESVDILDRQFLVLSQINHEDDEAHRLEVKPSVVRQEIGRINHQ